MKQTEHLTNEQHSSPFQQELATDFFCEFRWAQLNMKRRGMAQTKIHSLVFYDGRPAIGNVHRSEGSCPFLEEIPVLSTTMTTLHSKTRHYLPPLRHTSASRVRHPRHCTVLKNLAAPPPRRPAAPFDDESAVLNLVPVFPRCRHPF